MRVWQLSSVRERAHVTCTAGEESKSIEEMLLTKHERLEKGTQIAEERFKNCRKRFHGLQKTGSWTAQSGFKDRRRQVQGLHETERGQPHVRKVALLQRRIRDQVCFLADPVVDEPCATSPFPTVTRQVKLGCDTRQRSTVDGQQ